MMTHAGLKKEMQAKLWAEAVKTACFLQNILVNSVRDVPPQQKWTGEDTMGWVKKLIQFGRIGYVLPKKQKVKAKITWETGGLREEILQGNNLFDKSCSA